MNTNNHNKNKEYHEYLAKIVLEEVFPKKYKNLIRSESPDLINSIGNNVEVTKAPYKGDEEAYSLFTKVMGLPIDKIDGRILERFKQLGHKIYEVNGKIIGHSLNEAIWETTNEIETAIIKKLDKIDKYTGETDLFIFAPSFDSYDERLIQDYTLFVAEQSSKHRKYFHIVYIFDFVSVYICNIDNKSSRRLLLDNSDVKSYVERARREFN